LDIVRCHAREAGMPTSDTCRKTIAMSIVSSLRQPAGQDGK
jgi:hypothetical protein